MTLLNDLVKRGQDYNDRASEVYKAVNAIPERLEAAILDVNVFAFFKMQALHAKMVAQSKPKPKKRPKGPRMSPEDL